MGNEFNQTNETDKVAETNATIKTAGERDLILANMGKQVDMEAVRALRQRDTKAGRIEHKDVLDYLLSEIEPTDLKAAIGLPAGQEMRERHYQFAVATTLIKLAESRHWNLRTLNEYVYVYNGAWWKQHNKEDMKNFLGMAATNMGMAEYDAHYFKFQDNLFRQFLRNSHFPAPEPDENKILINLKNGTFEFKDGQWHHKEFDANDFLTYQLPFAYNPHATSPLFNRYLEKVMPDDCSRNVLQEFAGYIFTKMNLEKCLVLTGDGSNGKSVFFRILTALVGRENTLTYSMSAFNNEGNRAKLSSVLMNYSPDSGFKLAPDIFKALVSCEPVHARELYCNPFTLHNKAKFLMNCNVLPAETENTLGYFRRFLIMPFEVTITEAERDINLADKIIASELPGVFNWLLAGLERLVEQQQFSYCDKAECALTNYKRTADTCQLFIDDHGLQPSSGEKELLINLYKRYEEFCKTEQLVPVGKSTFSRELEKKGFMRMPRLKDGISFGVEQQK